MRSFISKWFQALRRFLFRLPALLGVVMVAVARRRRWQLVATLVVGVLLGAAAIGALGLQSGHPTGTGGGREAFEHLGRTFHEDHQ